MKQITNEQFDLMINIYNALCTIPTTGDSTIIMAEVLKAQKGLIVDLQQQLDERKET